MKKLILITTLIIVSSSMFFAFATLAGYKIEVSIPEGSASGEEVNLTQYIKYLYTFGLGLIGITALGALVIGGFMYMGAETVTTKDQAKGYINGAISGLILGLAAYLILYTINPDLINLEITAPPSIPQTSTPISTPSTPSTPTSSCTPGDCPASCEVPCSSSQYWDTDICTCLMLGT